MKNGENKEKVGGGTVRVDPERRGMTISQYLAQHGLGEGAGVGLDREVAASSFLSDEDGRKYSVGGLVAKGSMGAILRVRDLNVRRSVAMKVMLDPEQVTQPRILRFIEEAQITGQLEHPSIVPVHELGVDSNGNVFYTMKLVKGMTLKEIVNGVIDGRPEVIHKYPLGILLNIFLKACDAIAFAHTKGVVHRDLKPENIMVGDYGEVLVMDWGLAKIVAEQTVRKRGDVRPEDERTAIESLRSDEGGSGLDTLDGEIMGTPAFMAPEQALGRVDEIDMRTDIYALGAILYKILTLHSHVESDTVREMLHRVLAGDHVPPTAYNELEMAGGQRRAAKRKVRNVAELRKRALEASQRTRHGETDYAGPLPHCPGNRIPSALSAVAMKALARSADGRYQSVQELQRDIVAYQGGFATSAEEAGTLRQLGLLIKRRKAEAGLLAVACLVLFAVVAGFVLQLNAEKNRAVANERKAVEALRNLKREQTARKELSKASAPEFVTKTKKLMDLKRWNEAHEAIDTAVDLDESSSEAWLLKGRLALGDQSFAEAEEAFRQAAENILPGSPDHQRIKRYENLAKQCKDLVERRGGRKAKDMTLALARALQKCKDYLISSRLLAECGTEAGQESSFQEIQLRAAIEGLRENNDGLEHDVEYGISEADGMFIHTHSEAVVDLTPLAKLPLASVDLSGTSVRDISPLADMSVKSLVLSNTQVSDISALKGMPLQTLDLEGAKVSDISALENMPLVRLILKETPVSDIAALTGSRLTHLDLNRTRVNDIAAVGGMPLTYLDLNRTEVSDVDVLKGMPLSHLDLDETLVADISVLVKMPLTYLGLRNLPVSDVSVLKGMRLTELDLSETRVSDISVLKGMPLTQLDLAGAPVNDISALKGMRLTQLNLSRTAVADISVLAGMPLTRLQLGGTPVSDISVLTGMPLEELVLHDAPVSDISVLKGMPLTQLDLHQCPNIRKLTPIASCKKLEKLAIPEQCKDIEFLRNLSNLKVLDDRTRLVDTEQTAAEFWRRFDERKIAVKIEAALGKDNPDYDGEGTFESEEGKIVHANLSNTKVKEIRALAGMPLKKLYLGGTEVSDISALEGMPLTYLSLQNAQVSDISVLRGKALTYLNLSATQVADISALAGMPLTFLNLAATKVTDVSALEGMPLTYLDLPKTQVGDISVLKGMPLKHLSFGGPVHDISVLKGMPLAHLDLSATFVSDISVLGDAPLTHLDLSVTPVDDVSVLKGLPLTHLDLRSTGVSDISALKGMSLKSLSLSYSKVDDIMVLKGMPLKELCLYKCDRLANLSPLVECEQLERLAIPEHCKEIEFLRNLPNLTVLDNKTEAQVTKRTAAEFWKDYDADKGTRAADKP